MPSAVEQEKRKSDWNRPFLVIFNHFHLLPIDIVVARSANSLRHIGFTPKRNLHNPPNHKRTLG
ncbi:hypothetical protein CV_0682 [Chromobacterium violaceum ATCC 12472]|uniref:Uncharacterized protein n=1 Tax=Chromobacterium violaceum (strain ATCC 12472 / DSM 30191 / JCM 1249 / CCUG 213 / NBRC 12614 / NCIMB 9131 / NCTC 9757 / MK) TaxID=243365 RepID=Q7P086_CHRVO|nr:hypothetical protein CV_0682 [Chromobacterium violaceum ATCC 12472]